MVAGCDPAGCGVVGDPAVARDSSGCGSAAGCA